MQEKEIIALGTTKRGIGPCYIDKYSRIGIRMGEFIDEDLFLERLKETFPMKVMEYPELEGHSLLKVFLKNIKNMPK